MQNRRLVSIKCNECGQHIGSAVLEFDECKADLKDTWQVKSVVHSGRFRLSFICSECILARSRRSVE